MSDYPNLHKWTMPDSYFGETWPDYYSAGVGQSRDSSCLEQSNFSAMLRLLGGESETVIVVRESHWAVGWVEWIAIHESDDKALTEANEAMGALSDYPVLDESDYSEREYNDYCESWQNWACKEFTRELIRKFDLGDDAEDKLEDLSYDAAREFYESLIPSGEYYIDESSGVYVNVKLAVDHCEITDLVELLGMDQWALIGEESPEDVVLSSHISDDRQTDLPL
jgi:hypothetical protein